MRRLKRWQKVVGILPLLLVVLPAVAWLLADRLGRAAVQREIRALVAKGQTLSWKKLVPPEPPEGENAAFTYKEALALLAEDGPDTENFLVCKAGEPPWDARALEKLCQGAAARESRSPPSPGICTGRR